MRSKARSGFILLISLGCFAMSVPVLYSISLLEMQRRLSVLEKSIGNLTGLSVEQSNRIQRLYSKLEFVTVPSETK